MRVLLVTQYYWPENFLINNVVPLLVARGIEVTVLTGKPNYPDGLIFPGYKASGIMIEDHHQAKLIRVPILPRGSRSKFRIALNYLSFLLSVFIFGDRLVRELKYDLVFVYAPSPLLQALAAIPLARNRRVPLIVWVQDLWPESLSAFKVVRNKWLLAVVGYLVRLIYRSCDRILVQSQAFVSPVSLLTDDPNKIYYYPNFYQLNSDQAPSPRALELVKTLNEQFSVVFTGNLGQAQSLDTIVAVARILRAHVHIRIVLVGSGTLDNWLADQKAKYGLTNLILAGRFDASDMQSIFEASDALLVSLQRDPALSLTIPSKLQAYLAAGRPILAALDGEGARIVHEAEAGFCSEAANDTALADNILKMAALSPLERLQMGINGRQYFNENFSPDELANKLVDHFKSTISKREHSQ